MSDIFTWFNFLEIQNGKDADRAARKLDDLKDEAAHMEKKGLKPASWYEFKQEIPEKKPHYVQNMGLGAVVGVGLAAGIGAILSAPISIPLIGMGALIGGSAFAYNDTENSQRKAKVNAYEDYLQKFKGQARIESKMSHHNDLADMHKELDRMASGEDKFTDALKAEREKEEENKGHGCGCSKG